MSWSAVHPHLAVDTYTVAILCAVLWLYCSYPVVILCLYCGYTVAVLCCTVAILCAVLWLYHGYTLSCTVAIPWLYSVLYCGYTAPILWLYCACIVAILWLYCAVLWLYSGLYCGYTMAILCIVLWLYHSYTLCCIVAILHLYSLLWLYCACIVAILWLYCACTVAILRAVLWLTLSAPANSKSPLFSSSTPSTLHKSKALHSLAKTPALRSHTVCMCYVLWNFQCIRWGLLSSYRAINAYFTDDLCSICPVTLSLSCPPPLSQQVLLLILMVFSVAGCKINHLVWMRMGEP